MCSIFILSQVSLSHRLGIKIINIVHTGFTFTGTIVGLIFRTKMARQSFGYDDIIRDGGRSFFGHLDNSIQEILRENGSEEQIAFVEAYNRLSEFVAGRSIDPRIGDNPDARRRLSDIIMSLGALHARFSGYIQDGWPGFDLNGCMYEALRVQQEQEFLLSWNVLQASLRAQRGTVDHAAQAEVEEVVAGLEQALQLVQGDDEHGVVVVNVGAGVEIVPGVVAATDQENVSDASDSESEIEP